MIILNFALVMAIVKYAIPFAWSSVQITWTQAAVVTFLAFVWRTLLSPEPPEVFLINGKQEEEID